MCATSAASPRRDCFEALDRRTRSSSSVSAEISFDSSLMLIRCYNMDFFDPQRWRVTNTNTSKHFRSLFEEESTAVASSALTESATAHALALLSSRVEKTVKKKVTSMPSFFQLLFRRDVVYPTEHGSSPLLARGAIAFGTAPRVAVSATGPTSTRHDPVVGIVNSRYAEFDIATLPGESSPNHSSRNVSFATNS